MAKRKINLFINCLRTRLRQLIDRTPPSDKGLVIKEHFFASEDKHVLAILLKLFFYFSLDLTM